MSASDNLKLIALDADDLAVMSAHVQNAAVSPAQMAWLPREKRFALLCRRTCQIGAPHEHLCGLHFDRVTRVERMKIAPDATGELTLIGLTFATTNSPAGQIGMIFENGAAIRLTVECIEAALRDLDDHTGDA
ncbi:MAG: DUF2948 family protein [Beijerinckiaceae bacterium]